jgi:16S rRNA (guanine527-N7)-methyltransferase
VNVAGGDEPAELIETLRDAQRFGFFGSAPIEDAVAHARSFVAALADLDSGSHLADIGSGGGLPGLVIAAARPDLSVVLIDRRQKRTDFLERAVRRLGWARVVVWSADVEQVARSVTTGTTPAFDAVTARGFGPPETTLRVAAQLIHRHRGTIVISEPPSSGTTDGDRWPPDLLMSLDLQSVQDGVVRRFDRTTNR